MSSRGSKKYPPKSSWSAWVWDTARQQYYQAREHSNGEWEYRWEYAPQENAGAIPRSVETTTPVATSPGSSTGSTYSPNYGYHNAKRPADPMDTLTAGMSNTSLTNTPGTYFGQSDYPSSQPIPIVGASSSTGTFGHGSFGQSPGYSMGTNSSNTEPAPGTWAASSSSTCHSGQDPYDDSCSSTPRAGYDPLSGTDRDRPANNYGAPNRGITQPYNSGQPSGSGAVTKGKLINGTPGKTELLNKNFRIHSSKHFGLGKVFKILWSEPAGMHSTATTTVTNSTLGENVMSKIRRFIIVKTSPGHSICVPILTYGHQGLKKPGAKTEDHAIVYIGEVPSNSDPGYYTAKDPIRIEPISPQHKLDPCSVINYAKYYTVEHNVKVLFIGRVHKDWERVFFAEVDGTWGRK